MLRTVLSNDDWTMLDNGNSLSKIQDAQFDCVEEWTTLDVLSGVSCLLTTSSTPNWVILWQLATSLVKLNFTLF